MAAHPELEVLFVPGLPVRGLYAPDLQVIAIRHGETRRMRRSILAEEFAHHVLGHRPHPDRLEMGRMELRARRWAARQLVSVEDLADAVNSVGEPTLAAVSEELDIDPALLEQRMGDLTDSECREVRHRLGRRELRL